MALTVRTVPLTDAERRAAGRINSGLALVPRLKTDGPHLIWGQRLNGVASRAAGTVTASVLARRGCSVTALSIPGPAGDIPLRLLIPAGEARGLVLDFHGGGWVVGSAALNDRVNAHLVEAGLAVASVDYRLLDEVRGVWMADAVADCVAALHWAIHEGADRFGSGRLLTAGESAGAHLSALSVLSLSPDMRRRLVGCVFVQGVFDLSGTPSVHAAGRDCLLFDGPNLARDLARLTPDRDEAGRRLPDVSPLHADLTGAPPALFVTGERDPLGDDSRLMAEAWSRQADAVLLHTPMAPHGFQHFGGPAVGAAQAEIRAWIERRLADAADSGENPNT